jgi:hypothetical protein
MQQQEAIPVVVYHNNNNKQLCDRASSQISLNLSLLEQTTKKETSQIHQKDDEDYYT